MARRPAYRTMLYPALALVACVPVAAWRGTYFVADDWMILARYLSFSWADVPGWFVSVRHDWYRPVFELWVAAGWRLFGAEPAGYHIAALAVYVAVGALAGRLGEAISGDRRVGVLATVAFAVFHFHAEPVLWLAAGSDLLAGLFVLGAFMAYVTYRHHGGRRWLMTAFVAYVTALGSKESAVLFPLAAVGYDLLLVPAAERRPGNTAAIWFLFAAVGAVAFGMRLAAGNPYPIEVTPALMARNAGHYAVLELLAAPIDFDILTLARPPSGAFPLPAVTTSLAGVSLLLLCGVWFGERGWRRPTCHPRALVFSGWFALVMLVPVLPIVAERTAFLSSAGVAWGLAIVAVCALDLSRARPRAYRWLVAAAIVVFGVANSAALWHRGRQWERAGQTSRAVMDQLAHEIEDVPLGSDVWLMNVPDHRAFAWTFRNAFHPDRPAAAEVLGLGRRIHAALDTEVGGRSPDEARRVLGVGERAVVLWYANGRLTRLPAQP